MSGTQFAMVSEWMPNGNISQFVKAHQNTNRFELVSFSRGFLQSSVVDDDAIFVAGRRCERVNLYAWSVNGPRRS